MQLKLYREIINWGNFYQEDQIKALELIYFKI